MRKAYLIGGVGTAALGAAGVAIASWYALRERADQLRYERGETDVIISNPAAISLHLFHAGKNLQDVSEIPVPRKNRLWLPPGNYFLRAGSGVQLFFYPIPITGYRGGPGREGELEATVRPLPRQSPPRLHRDTAEFVFIPSGYFVLGDRLNPREPHYVWLTGFFMRAFETTNAEFREFLDDPQGCGDAANWTEEGRAWKSTAASQASALLTPKDTEYDRFGQADQPVTNITWFEASAFCHWLTRKIGNNHWIFSLPTDAEWEKAARGPDNFDYSLGAEISDKETPQYNWKKNPGAPVTVVGIAESRGAYLPNRYGLYHMTGNVAEWTQSVYRTSNRQTPYADDDRNRDGASGRRSARGGSWYSATSAPLYTPYRDAFQPEHAGNDLGFRIVARLP